MRKREDTEAEEAAANQRPLSWTLTNQRPALDSIKIKEQIKHSGVEYLMNIETFTEIYAVHKLTQLKIEEHCRRQVCLRNQNPYVCVPKYKVIFF